MARIPAYAYRVLITKQPVGGNQPTFEQHNYTSLPGAWAYRETALRRPNTRKVEILLVLDESTPSHKD